MAEDTFLGMAGKTPGSQVRAHATRSTSTAHSKSIPGVQRRRVIITYLESKRIRLRSGIPILLNVFHAKTERNTHET